MTTPDSLAVLENDAQSYYLAAIERAPLAATTKAQYKKAITHYLETGRSLADSDDLADYAIQRPKSTRSFLKAAIKLVTGKMAIDLKGQATPANISATQAGLYRLEALTSAIQVQSEKGVKAHTWLSQKQVKDIMLTCGDDLQGVRDWVILGLLLGAGLRREELTTLRFTDLVEMPGKNGKPRVVLAVKGGKGAKDRLIPIKPILAERIHAWQHKVGGSGDELVGRSLGRAKVIGDSISTIGIFGIVRKHGESIGITGLDPHDCRRTYAQLGYEAGCPLTQISKLLGHSNIATTQRYLNLELDLEVTVSDFIPLE